MQQKNFHLFFHPPLRTPERDTRVRDPVECKNASLLEGHVQGETRVGVGYCPKCSL